MLQLIQNYKTGVMELIEVPAPICHDYGVVIRTKCSVVSSGTEKMITDFARKNIFEKMRSRPDLVKRVFEKMKREGIASALTKTMAKLDTPIALGYSCCGIIEQKGVLVRSGSIGDRVACAGAGYANHAQFNYVPANLFVKVPEKVADEDAAFTTIGAIALQGIRQASPSIGEIVAVIGLGLLGQLTVQMLKAAGCRVLCSDPDNQRTKMALEAGADAAVTANELEQAAEDFSSGYGVDRVIICAATNSDEPVNTAARICRKKGTVVMVGLTGMNIDREYYHKKELQLLFSNSAGPGRYDPLYEEAGIDYPYPYVRWTEQRNMEAFLDLVASGAVTPSKLITHRFDFSNAIKAYDILNSKTEHYLGIVLTYGEAQLSRKIRMVQKTMPNRQQLIKAGFIGAGNFFRGVLMPAIADSKRFSFEAISTATAVSARLVAEKYGFKTIMSDYHELLADKSIEVVFIGTRHNLHARQVIDSLEAGKNVFVEKPLCLTNEELDEIVSYMQKYPKQVVVVGFNRRHSPILKKMISFLHSTAASYALHYRVNAGPIAADHWIHNSEIGGGRIVGEACHFIDTAKAICSDSAITKIECIPICCGAFQQHPPDNVKIMIKFANGSVATIDYLSGMAQSLRKEYIEASAAGRTAILNDFAKLELFVGTKCKKISTTQDKGFRAEIEWFADIIEGKTPYNPETMIDVMRATLHCATSY